jgi:hypothetical protein
MQISGIPNFRSVGQLGTMASATAAQLARRDRRTRHATNVLEGMVIGSD